MRVFTQRWALIEQAGGRGRMGSEAIHTQDQTKEGAVLVKETQQGQKEFLECQ